MDLILILLSMMDLILLLLFVGLLIYCILLHEKIKRLYDDHIDLSIKVSRLNYLFDALTQNICISTDEPRRIELERSSVPETQEPSNTTKSNS